MRIPFLFNIVSPMMTELQRKSYPGLLFTDPSFQTEQSAGCSMNIFLNESQFIFCIISGNTLLHIQSFNFFQFNNPNEYYSTIRDLLDKEDLFNLNYQSINIYLYNGLNTLIPTAIFDNSYLEDYHLFNFDTASKHHTGYDIIESLEAVNVYGYADELKKLFETKFKNHCIYHNSTALLQYLSKQDRQAEQVYVYVQPQWMQVIIFNAQQLIFCNSFHYSTPEDFIYFLLYTYQQLKLEPETIPVNLMGEIVKDSVLYEQLYKYVRHIHFMKRPAELEVNSNFSMPSHFYFNLFCAGL